MKKIALFLVAAAIILAPASAQALSVGNWGGWGVLGMQLNESISGYLGYSSFGATSSSEFLIKADYNLAKLGEVQTRAGVVYTSFSSTNTSSLGLTWGGSVMAAKNLSVGFDVVLAQLNNPSSTDILPYSAMTASIIL